MLSPHLFSLFVYSLALSVQAASVMPTSASEESQHIGHKTQYMPYHVVERRSFNIGDFPLTVLPTSARVSSPIVLKLHPPAGKPSHLHANLPLRFGRRREAEPTREQQTPSKSFLNLPQRFGREQECSRCTRSGTPPSATLPQRFGRRQALSTLDWLPFRKVASILVPASKSSEVDIRNSFDDNSSEWRENTAVAVKTRKTSPTPNSSGRSLVVMVAGERPLSEDSAAVCCYNNRGPELE
ncbi:hypothetical protein ACEWY4_024228 [Coilia grayii]|uniref:Secreted protein n=1 Tax=Coilia grayii TaxID=363190 RepID=A0ABD1IZR1_9TELE